jgi:hypothetical protein
VTVRSHAVPGPWPCNSWPLNGGPRRIHGVCSRDLDFKLTLIVTSTEYSESIGSLVAALGDDSISNYVCKLQAATLDSPISQAHALAEVPSGGMKRPGRSRIDVGYHAKFE